MIWVLIGVVSSMALVLGAVVLLGLLTTPVGSLAFLSLALWLNARRIYCRARESSSRSPR